MIREYLRNKGIIFKEVSRPSGLQAIFPCPKCGKNKFAISLENGAFQCFRQNECNFRGSWWDFQKFYNDTPKRLNNNYFIKTDKREYKKPQVNARVVNQPALDWLRSRGFTDEIIRFFKIGITENNDIMLPSFIGGELKNVKYRSIKEKKFWNEKDAMPVLFNMDNIEGDTLVLVEGHFDSMAAKHYRINAASVPNGTQDTQWIELCWTWLERFKRIYIVFDNDSAGQSVILNLANRLGKYRCYNVILPLKDFNECLINNIPVEKINECINNATEFFHPDIVPADFFVDAIVDSYKTGEYTGITTGMSGLDKILGGWRQKEVTLWTGSNGSGKSTMLNKVILNLVKTDFICCIASLEMHPIKYLRWMIGQYFCGIVSDDKVFDFMARFGHKIYVFNSTKKTEPDLLIDAFSFAAKKYGVTNFFIDSLMKVRFKSREEYREQTEFISSLTDFAKEFDSHVHLVAHPRKGDNDEKQPDKVDVAGSGHITDLVDNVLMMWRASEKVKEQQGFDNMMAVKKNREHGREGKVYFTFDEFSKDFKEIDDFKWKTSGKKNPDYFND